MSLATSTRLPSPSTFGSRPPAARSPACPAGEIRYEIRCVFTCRQKPDYDRVIQVFLSDLVCPFMYRFWPKVDRVKVFTCIYLSYLFLYPIMTACKRTDSYQKSFLILLPLTLQSIRHAVSDCLITIAVSDSLYPIPKSVALLI